MKSPVTYAMTVLLIVTLCNVLARGIGEGYAVFVLPLTEEFGWSRSKVTSVYSIYMLAHGAMAPFMGWLFDRFGARITYGFGFSIMGLGFILASFSQGIWQLYIGVGLGAGIGVAAIGMVTAAGLVARWFNDRLTLAMGVAYGGLGAGVIALAPFTEILIQNYGWRSTYQIMGTTLLIICPLILALPWSKLAAGNPAFYGKPDPVSVKEHIGSLLRAFATVPFWAITVAFFLTAVTIYAVALQSVAYLVENGYSPLTAATAYGIAGALSVVGMVFTAWLGDVFGRKRVLTFSYSFSAIGILFLAFIGYWNATVFLLGYVLFFGLTQGSRGPVFSSLVAIHFPKHVAAVYGATTMGLGAGGAFGGYVSGLLLDLTGSYVPAFLLSATAAMLALAMFYFIPSLQAKPRRSAGH